MGSSSKKSPTVKGAAPAAPPIEEAEKHYAKTRSELLGKRYCGGLLKMSPVVGFLQMRKIRQMANDIRKSMGAALPTGGAISIDGIIDLFADAASDYAPRLFEFILIPENARTWNSSIMAKTGEILEENNLDFEEMLEVKDDFFALHPRATRLFADFWRKLCLVGITIGELANKFLTARTMTISPSSLESPTETPPDMNDSSISTIPIISESLSGGPTTATMPGIEPTPPPTI